MLLITNIRRQPLGVAGCSHQAWDAYIWLTLNSAIIAGNSYVTEVLAIIAIVTIIAIITIITD